MLLLSQPLLCQRRWPILRTATFSSLHLAHAIPTLTDWLLLRFRVGQAVAEDSESESESDSEEQPDQLESGDPEQEVTGSEAPSVTEPSATT